jgi:hypothetical protein
MKGFPEAFIRPVVVEALVTLRGSESPACGKPQSVSCIRLRFCALERCPLDNDHRSLEDGQFRRRYCLVLTGLRYPVPHIAQELGRKAGEFSSCHPKSRRKNETIIPENRLLMR